MKLLCASLLAFLNAPWANASHLDTLEPLCEDTAFLPSPAHGAAFPQDTLSQIEAHFKNPHCTSLKLTSENLASLGFKAPLSHVPSKIFYVSEANDLALLGRILGAGYWHEMTIGLVDTHFSDKDFNHLCHATRLLLYGRNITDMCLSHLQHIQHITLGECDQLTDEGLKHLNKAKSVSLHLCDKLTNDGLKSLENAEDVDLSWLEQINDSGLTHLQKVQRIRISMCGITGKGFESLKHAQHVILSAIRNVETGDFAALSGVKHLEISGTRLFDADLAYFEKANSVELRGCEHITDAGLKALAASHVSLALCPRITSKGLNALPNVKTLDVRGLREISQEDKDLLRARGVKVIGESLQGL